ncbi:recombinase family protein [Nocardia farcinica]|uniref:recombinase family protein n=1 Tax=Nocardia farcinica TaxID=37329 RepID=UPI003799877B
MEAAVVRKIYDRRVTERLSYEAIAERLNLDLAINPPPTPPDPERAVGRWTCSSVRDVLNQPKYTGHMVWNRRAMNTRNGSPNPMEKWVWSTEPTQEKIIDLTDFIAAQQVVRRRERSRTQAGANTHRRPSAPTGCGPTCSVRSAVAGCSGQDAPPARVLRLRAEEGLRPREAPGHPVGARSRAPRRPERVPQPPRARSGPAGVALLSPARPGHAG